MIYFQLNQQQINMKLYSLDDGPPSLACRMVLKALNLEWENIPVDYNSGEHLGG